MTIKYSRIESGTVDGCGADGRELSRLLALPMR